MSEQTAVNQTSRLGNWLPQSSSALNRWLSETVAAAQSTDRELHPAVRDLRSIVKSDAVLRMYFTQMFQQEPRFRPPEGSGDIKLHDFEQMLTVINHVLSTAPQFDTTDMVGFPINAILDFAMITPAGLAAFVHPRVNEALRKILRAWTVYLDSAESCYVLNAGPGGWLSQEALDAIAIDEFVHDATKPFYGFRSWNDFFIRRFIPGARPVAAPDNDKVIVSSCESRPYAIRTKVKKEDAFWVKSQPYSLTQLLDGQFVDQFAGGTVYQAFLSAENYHRWHSPVSGTIVMVRQVDGTYYAEAPSQGFDPVGPNNSQGYIAHIATRVLIFIRADDPCRRFDVCHPSRDGGGVVVRGHGRGGHLWAKGDELGYFQFGGSTHCLVFRPGVVSEFYLQAVPQGPNGTESSIVKVNSALATAS